jgi:hypothetical protein
MEDEGTVVLVRTKAGYRDSRRRYKVFLDGVEVGRIKRGETLRFPVGEGEHRLQLKIDWCASRPCVFAVGQGGTAAFGCGPGGPPGGFDAITVGAADYIALQPVEDPALVEAIAPSGGFRLFSVFGVVFFLACFCVIAGGIWHLADSRSHAADALLGVGIVVFYLCVVLFRFFKKRHAL